MSESVTPYKTEEGKKEQVKNMFNNTAGRYDFLNMLPVEPEILRSQH